MHELEKVVSVVKLASVGESMEGGWVMKLEVGTAWTKRLEGWLGL